MAQVDGPLDDQQHPHGDEHAEAVGVHLIRARVQQPHVVQVDHPEALVQQRHCESRVDARRHHADDQQHHLKARHDHVAPPLGRATGAGDELPLQHVEPAEQAQVEQEAGARDGLEAVDRRGARVPQPQLDDARDEADDHQRADELILTDPAQPRAELAQRRNLLDVLLHVVHHPRREKFLELARDSPLLVLLVSDAAPPRDLRGARAFGRGRARALAGGAVRQACCVMR
mmetsp:Transcript_26583/g.70928  ORF Transcript_26583/g.70928 Transcript_26583/m.70928 type:complete len:230 (-) Transcript_26583:87-776(-)